MLTYKLITMLCVILMYIYRKMKKVYSYWEKKGVKGPKPIWIVGNTWSILCKKESLNTLTKKISDMYPNERAVGIYLGVTPTLILRDPDLIKKVTVKDFSSFDDRGLKITEEELLDNMILEAGEKWKFYRQKLTPLFSTGRMKKNLPNLAYHTDEYLDYIESLPPGSKELRQLDHKLSIKYLMSSLVGQNVDIYNGDLSDLEEMGYYILKLHSRQILGTMLHGYNPNLLAAIDLKVLAPKLENSIKNLLNINKKTREENPNRNESVFDFLVNLKDQGVFIKEKGHHISKFEISDSALVGHAMIFFISGFESFVTSSFLLFELALNQEVQERCYKEIVEVMKKYNNNLTFDATTEMEYLNMAFNESIRKYPSGGNLTRIATKDYHFEDINLTINKNTNVVAPVLAIHHNPRYHPDPQTFDPERFTPENRKKMKDCSYLAFGEGPRKCVGYRLARFQNILLLAKFLHRFKLTPCEKTVPKVQFLPYQFSLYAQDGLWVNITKRQ